MERQGVSDCRRTLASGLVALAALLPLSGGPLAKPPPTTERLTLAGALSTARQQSRLARVARARIGEARGDLTGASIILADNPEVAVEAGPRIGGSDRGSSVEVGVGIEQRFETGGQRRYRMLQARAKVDASSAMAVEAERVIDLAVARTFYSALAADLRLGLMRESEELARQLHDSEQRRIEAGEGKPLQASAARLRLAEAQRRVLVAQANRDTAGVRLAELLGLPPSTEISLQGELPNVERIAEPGALVSKALQSRPELGSAAYRLEGADAAVELAEAEALPDVGVGVFYEQEEGAHIVTAGVRVPLPFFERNQGARQRKTATRERLVAERDALRLAIESEARRALIAYQRAATAVSLYDAEVLRTQAETLALLRRALAAGEVGIPDVLIVHREMLEGREGYLDARLELAHARARVLAAAGAPQTSSLEEETP